MDSFIKAVVYNLVLLVQPLSIMGCESALFPEARMTLCTEAPAFFPSVTTFLYSSCYFTLVSFCYV